MGLDRKPPLPAPTESSTLQTSGGSGEEADLATDISRRTDKTSYSVPEDGTPVLVPVKKRREHRDREKEGPLARTSHQSQTSLLIEYFEGGKGPSVHTRPSVRVKVTPSAARKIQDTNEHVQVTQSKGNRKPSYTRRISLGPYTSGDRQVSGSGDDKSISSYTSAAEESTLTQRHPPVEIEVLPRDDASDFSRMSMGIEEIAREERYIQVNPSDISSMPPDSMLEGKAGSITPRHNRSRDAVVTTTDTLKTPSRRRSRSISKERIVDKTMEKLVGKSREGSSGKHKHSSKTRSRSVSSEQLTDTHKSGRRRSSKQHKEVESPSGAESSLLTFQMSPQRQSGDQYSFRSTTSKSSINANPKLLETVENAIRRLIIPELESLKKEQKMQQSRQKFDRDNRDSLVSDSSISRNDLSRKLSKHASAPEVSNQPKVVLNRDEHNPGTLLSGDSVNGRKGSRRDRKSESPLEHRVEREMSEETVIRDGEKPSRKRSKDSHKLRDAAAGGTVGGILTAAALNHHDLTHQDSKSSIDRKERRRRRSSRSHSRSASLAETEDIFNKHDVPPMPMQSDIHSSELTRESILSERTEEPLSPDKSRMTEIRHVSRGSPREVLSPASRTPTRSPFDKHEKLGMRHSNISRERIDESSPGGIVSPRDEEHHSKLVEAGITGAAAGAGALAAHRFKERHDQYSANEYMYQHDPRGLSPIQSVSSRQESEGDRRSFMHKHSTGSISSLKQLRKKASGASTRSLGSPVSVDLRRLNRPRGINFEPGEDVLDQHGLRDSQYTEGEYSDRDPAVDEWLEQEHKKNDRYRDSIGDDSYRDSLVDYKHMTNFTDDSLDAPYLDRVTAAQELQVGGGGRNPDFVHTPMAVESAVASLLDTSTISMRSKQGEKAYAESHEEDCAGAVAERTIVEDIRSKESLRENQDNASIEEPYHLDQHSAKDSPRQSIARSVDEEPIPMGASGLPIADDPIPEIGHGLQSDSEISTNPSIIQGPIGGFQAENLDHWPNKPTPTSKNSSAHESLKAAAAGYLATAALASQNKASPERQGQVRELPANEEYHQPSYENLYENNVNHDFGPHRDSYISGQHIPSPPKDEGYISGPQRGPASPEISFNKARAFNDNGTDGMVDDDDDPFIATGHARHLSTNSHGLAHGMGSPIYDSATGAGIDRIQSKDIVALMDHLTVRDAQRNARDTEILVTLVRSAAEMRNSFEEMKKFIAEQDDLLVDAGNKQHERTIQKIVLGGPRPQPLTTSKKSSMEDEDDLPAKRRSVFRRALKGLSSRNQNDIGKIEEMLVHLLGEVEGLRATQDLRPSAGATRNGSLDSYNNLRAAGPEGYEPEGRAGTGSTGQSGYFSNPPSRDTSAVRIRDGRFGSQNRVSTVLEADEEPDAHEPNVLDNQFEKNEQLLTPTKESPQAGSLPLHTPPQVHMPTGTQSNEHTPKTGSDKNRKHKSSSSSFFPKISRWSRTTASSVGDNFRNSTGRKERPFSEASRSGSESQHYDNNEHYDPEGDDRLRSNDSIENDDSTPHENRPPSPLIPSQVSEDPKYQAHRNSLNLQHPQPRPGPTQRFQQQLESRAQNYGARSPISPTSDTFGSDPALARYPPGPCNRFSGVTGHLSPISDAGYSENTAAPPRPPKVRDDGPLIPASPVRPPKIAGKDNRPTFASSLNPEHLQPEQRYSSGSAHDPAKDSPRSASSAAPQRKPTGPRPITSSGSYSPDKDGVKRTRYRGSPNRIPSSTEDVTF